MRSGTSFLNAVRKNSLSIILTFVAIVGFIQSIIYAKDFITFKLTYFILLGSAFIYSLLILFFFNKKIRWLNTGNRKIKIGMILKLLHVPIILCTIFLLALSSLSYFTLKQTPDFAPVIAHKIFNKEDKSIRVLVLPFNKECDYEGKTYDIGQVITKRLIQLIETDTLSMKVKYFTDSISFLNFSLANADSIQKYHNSDLVIYGSYSFKECEASTRDAVCFNYSLNEKSIIMEEKEFNGNYKMTPFNGLADIRKGAGQEDIDFIIYATAALPARKSGDTEKAIRLLKKIKNYQKNSFALGIIGDCYYFSLNFSKAKEYYLQANQISSKHFFVSYNLTSIYSFLKNYDSCEYFLNQALRANPKSVESWCNLAIVKGIKNEPLEELKYLNTAMNIDSNNYLFLKYFGTYNLKQNENSKALYFLLKAKSFINNDHEVLSNIGVAYYNLKIYDSAIVYWKKSQSIYGSLINLAVFYEDTQNFHELKYYLEKLISIKPSSEDWYRLAKCLKNLKDYQAAVHAYKHCRALDSLNVNIYEILVNIGDCYILLGDTSQAMDYYKAGYKANNNVPSTWERIADLNMGYFKNYSEAESWYKKLIPRATHNVENLFYCLSKVNSKVKDRDEALFYMRITLNHNPNYLLLFNKKEDFGWLFTDKIYKKYYYEGSRSIRLNN